MLVITFVLAAATVAAQVSTTPVQGLRSPVKRLVAYVNCTAVTEPGRTISDAVIIVQNNRILAVGSGTPIPAGADIRDMKGAWAYAGFIDPFMEASSLSARRGRKDRDGNVSSDDADESPSTPVPDGARHWNQAVRPEREVLENLNVSDDGVRAMTKAGFTAVNVASHDGIFSGYGSSILLRAGDVAPNVLLPRSAQYLSFRKGSSATPYPSSLMGSIALLRQTFMDALWYGQSRKQRSTPTADDAEVNISLEALHAAISSGIPFVVTAYDEHDVARWRSVATEAKIRIIIKGSGSEYKRLADMARMKPDLILPLTLPDVPDVRDPVAAAHVPLADLMHWYWAPDNARLLDSVGCRFAFTTHGAKDPTAALATLRSLVKKHGLDSLKALAALTTIPADFLGLNGQIGSIAAGKVANLVFFSGPLFNDKSVVQCAVVGGDYMGIAEPPPVDIRGTWTLTSSSLVKPITLEISGTAASPSLEVRADSARVDAKIEVRNKRVTFSLQLDSVGIKGTARTSASADSILMKGSIVMPDGSQSQCLLRRDKPFSPKPEKPTPAPGVRMPLPPTLPFGPFGFDSTPPLADVVLKNATVWTCAAQGVLTNADVAIAGGKIVGVGKGLSGAQTIDCSGKHITPGIIDEHSHIAIARGVNEGTHAVTTEVRIGDVVDPDDINIYRQLAGGVTVSHLLHGSANPMGGQLQCIRLRWGANAEELKQSNAKPTVKFALGENVKQSNWGDRYTTRYPQSRMGVEEIMRDAFAAARDYEQRRAKGSIGGTPVRRDLQMDALVEILNQQRNIHCHSYKQSEILMLMRLAEEFGFRVATFTHILEGYKVAREMKQHGVHASSFADWWAYKFEVYDAIPQNPAIMHEQGVLVSVNSDDAEMARRLNQEAGKSVSYGGVSEEDALKFVTLNPAIQMELQSSLGSLETGKDADVVVWSGNPLSNLSRAERTFVEGRELFSLEMDQKLRKRDAALRTQLEQAALLAIQGGAGVAAAGSPRRREYHCDSADDEVAGISAP